MELVDVTERASSDSKVVLLFPVNDREAIVDLWLKGFLHFLETFERRPSRRNCVTGGKDVSYDGRGCCVETRARMISITISGVGFSFRSEPETKKTRTRSS